MPFSANKHYSCYCCRDFCLWLYVCVVCVAEDVPQGEGDPTYYYYYDDDYYDCYYYCYYYYYYYYHYHYSTTH